jgi:hypothetical protein
VRTPRWSLVTTIFCVHPDSYKSHPPITDDIVARTQSLPVILGTDPVVSARQEACRKTFSSSWSILTLETVPHHEEIPFLGCK